MASSKLILAIVFLLARGLRLATASVLPKRPKLIKDCEQAGLRYRHFAEESVWEEGAAPAGLSTATLGTGLLAGEALTLELVGR